MGLKVAAVTRLAKEDFHVAEKLKGLGVDVFAHISSQSTCLRLEYPTSNLDERVIYVCNQFSRSFYSLPKWKKSKPEQLL